MKTPLRLRSVFGLFLSIPILVLACAPAYAQWVKLPTGSIPRGPDGKPNLSAPAARLPDGRADLSGIWEPNGNKYVLDIAADLKPGDVPFQPWAKALLDRSEEHTSELQSPCNLVCRLLLEKKKRLPYV